MSLGLSTALVIFFAALYLRRQKIRLPLPPGPRGLSLVRCLIDLPKSFEWIAFDRWCKDFDTDILYLNIPIQPMLIVNKYETAKELFQNRSAIYSSRPCIPMVDIAGISYLAGPAFAPYGKIWREGRRLVHQVVREQTVELYSKHINDARRLLLSRLLDDPKGFYKHATVTAANAMSRLSYGTGIESEEDPHLVIINELLAETLKMSTPGSYLVNLLPFLRHVPDWFPGSGFKQVARKVAAILRKGLDIPYIRAQKNGFDENCAISLLLKSNPGKDCNDDFERNLKGVALALFTAGTDTTANVLMFFFLAMASFPKVQESAQKELPSDFRDPHFQLLAHEDSDLYPYTTALVLEVLRWASVAPLGIPHMNISDDVYDGYRIPAGTSIIANQWAMLHDEDVYPNPDKFDPSRFLSKDGHINEEIRNPMDIVFGFGRRVCPGRHLAFAYLWTAISSILTLFEISPPEGGMREVKLETGILVHPAPFECLIRPRSKEMERIIQELNV